MPCPGVMSSEEFDGKTLRLRAEGNEGEERIGAEAKDAEVAGGFVGDEEHAGLFVGAGKIEAHGAGRRADVDGLGDAAIDDIDGKNVTSRAVGDIHLGSVFTEDGTGGRIADEKGIADLVRPGVDGLQDVGFGRNDVKFAAVGLEQHLRRSAGEFEIGEQDGAL